MHMRIRNSFDIAHEKGLKFSFTPNEQETDIHPNTVDICMENEKGQKMTVRGESLGGGKVRIVNINHLPFLPVFQQLPHLQAMPQNHPEYACLTVRVPGIDSAEKGK